MTLVPLPYITNPVMHLCAVIQQWELQGIARYEYASLSWTGLQGETDYCFCP